MCFGDESKSYRNIPALVSVAMHPVLICVQEVSALILRAKYEYVTTGHTNEYCCLALDCGHSFCSRGPSLMLDSALVVGCRQKD